MGGPIAWAVGVLGALRRRRSPSRTRGGPAAAANSTVLAPSSAPAAPRRLDPHAARWVRWARQAERLRWSGRGLPLLPEEPCWDGLSTAGPKHGHRAEPPDRGRWESVEHPVRAYVLTALSEGAVHG